jgi:hypothetical protein
MSGCAGDEAAASPSVITLGIAGGSGGGKVSEHSVDGRPVRQELLDLTQVPSSDDPRARFVQRTWR